MGFDVGDVLGGLISAGADLFNGFANRQAAKDQNSMNAQMQWALANSGIQMKVEDAKRAGINPLAALGASTSSWSNTVGDTGLGDSVSKAGQDIGRAVASGMSGEDKTESLKRELLRTQIDASKADVVHSQLLNSQLARSVAADGSPPNRPVGANVPLPRIAPWKVGRLPAFQEFYDRNGNTIVGLSKDLSQSVMNIHSAPLAPEIGAKLLGHNYGPDRPNVPSAGWDAGFPRPDVRRRLEGWSSDVPYMY